MVYVSARSGEGLDRLFEAIKETCANGISEADVFIEADVITRERHRLLLEEALEYVTSALTDFNAGVAEDIAAIALRKAYLSLGHILGLEYADDIIDRIFAEFCVGK